LSNHKVK